MSTIKVDSIKSADGNTDLLTLSNGAVSGVNLGRRNLIINGAMQVAQRGTQVTGETGSGYKTCDRWHASISSMGGWTIDQSTDAPNGFSNSFKMTCTTADASPASADSIYLRYSIEAQDCQHLAYGGSSAKTTTLSFWVKSNKTGTYRVAPYVSDSGRILGATYTINSADTWEQKTITIIGDSGGAISNDNGDGLVLHFFLAAGSNFTSGTSPSAWTTYSAGIFGAGQTVNLADSTSNYFAITGVQLEVGSVATPFEHRSFGEELALCQRYYQIIEGFIGYSNGIGTELVVNAPFKIEMRSGPSVSVPNAVTVTRAFIADYTQSSGHAAYIASRYSTKAGQLNMQNFSGMAASTFHLHNVNSGALYFDAEL